MRDKKEHPGDMAEPVDRRLRLTRGIARARQIRGDATALSFGTLSLTWHQFGDRVARLAGVLQSLGLRDGDRVSILAHGSHRYVEALHAALWAGGVGAPVNSRFSRAEIAEMLRDCAPRVLIADDAFLAEAVSIAPGLPEPPVLIHAGEGPPPAGMIGYEAALAATPPIADAGRGGDDLACLFYTGGTTGQAKGVMLSHANLCTNALNVAGPVGLGENAIHLHCGPLFHLAAAGRMFAVTAFGGQHVVLRHFDAAEVRRAIARHRVTIATFVPTMIGSLLADPDFAAQDLSSLRIISYGAAPMPETLQRRLMEALPRCGLVQSYGMTETSPVVTMLTPEMHDPALGKLTSAGRVIANVDLRIADAEDRPVARGVVGEIQVRGPTVMLGYWNRPDLTEAALRGGWMHTGDGGYLDADGYLFVVDRLKDMIVSGGENVYSAEVENAIHSHPAVAECAVFGIPDAVWGEAVHAVVVPKDGQALTPAEVIAHCRGLIAGYKCPKAAEISAAPLPRSGVGKILKSALRAPWWADRARRVN
jgi:long-chain acyl-CoA synthetase